MLVTSLLGIYCVCRTSLFLSLGVVFLQGKYQTETRRRNGVVKKLRQSSTALSGRRNASFYNADIAGLSDEEVEVTRQTTLIRWY